ncbi:MAG: hypothetical protein AMK69_28235 [Nitrospira bacterium SG8_3]|nr:MAG: hypothetical protein AMK69_28235 [Nitrospira bacterium SG8_3]
MPGFDGTGPLGQGAMTGGGFGYCGSGRRPGYGLGGRGLGRGRRLSRGMGPGYGYRRPIGSYGWTRGVDANTELAGLEREADDLKGYLKVLEARMAELRKPSP